jgi:hypothetical protein
MIFRRVSPKNSLGAAIRSLQDGRTRGVMRSSNTVRVSQTTRGVIVQSKRKVSEDSSSGGTIPRWG